MSNTVYTTATIQDASQSSQDNIGSQKKIIHIKCNTNSGKKIVAKQNYN